MASMSSSVRAFQALGITSAAFLSGKSCSECYYDPKTYELYVPGGVFAASYFFAPALQYASDSVIARQWRTIYSRGIAAAPLISLISSSSFCFLSYKLFMTLNHPKSELYAVAALATISVLPYTLVIMAPTNEKLINLATKAELLSAGDEFVASSISQPETVRELVARWTKLNYGRGVFPLIGSFVAAWATFR